MEGILFLYLFVGRFKLEPPTGWRSFCILAHCGAGLQAIRIYTVMTKNIMRSTLLLLFAFFSFAAMAQPVKVHGRLSVRGTRLLDEKGQGLVLRGTSFGWHNYQPRFYNAPAVQWLAADWKCTVVRAALGVEPEGAYLDDSATALRRVESVIDGALKAGIYVIVDWHSHNIRLPEAKAFFTRMARRYGRNPNMIWEIFNEPDHESWPEVKAYAQELITTIRAIDPYNLILVGSPHWDQDLHLVAADPIRNARNIMYTMHFYAASHKKDLRYRCDAALAKGIPIFISESGGMEATGNGPLDTTAWKAYIDWAERNRISWLTWSVSDKNETCSMLEKSAATEGKWKVWDMKASGRITRGWLRAYNK
jgi:endoglucanase